MCKKTESLPLFCFLQKSDGRQVVFFRIVLSVIRLEQTPKEMGQACHLLVHNEHRVKKITSKHVN